jgi:urease accessory protein
MPRAVRILDPNEDRLGPITDTLLLSFDQRRMQAGMVFGEKGTAVEFDFAQPVQLRTDQVLLLEDGRLVEVVADAEMLIEIRAADARALAHLAWTLGEHHVPAHIFANRLRIRRSPDTEALVAALGLRGSVIHAPFEPESDLDTGHVCGHAHDHAHG